MDLASHAPLTRRLAVLVAAAGLIGARGASAYATDCVGAAAAAERAWAIPPGLLLAIGKVESGRFDAARREVVPSPLAVNAAGRGDFFDHVADAAAHVADLQQRGVRSIDIGCFQINLLHHPQAFDTPLAGFDPVRNANYAASFLASLYGRTGDWSAAAAHYHSGTPSLGDAYRLRVMSAWSGAPPPASVATLVAGSVAGRLDLASAGAATARGGVRLFSPTGVGMVLLSPAWRPRIVRPSFVVATGADGR